MKFNAEKWKISENVVNDDLGSRKSMLKDFTENHLKLKSEFPNNPSTIKEIEKLIGKPFKSDTFNSGFIQFHQVEEKYRYNVDPIGFTNLELRFDKDSALIHWQIINL